MLQGTEMDGPHSSRRAADKDKIREMLRDAIRILCQNTVPHHTKLSIEALVGITVDDGEDSIIVSISELISATDAKAYRYETEEQYHDTEADDSYPDYDVHETTVSDDSVFKNEVGNYDEQYNASVPYQAIVKQETSVIQYNIGQCDAFPHSSITSNQTTNQHIAGNGSYSGYETEHYGHQTAFNAGQKVTASGPRRGRGRGQVLQRAPRQKMTSVRSMPTVKQEYGGDVDAAAGSKRCSLESGEVSHVTLYTCQRCGKQFNNNSSFLRHKKSHLGIVYRCDGCGKILSRNDHLTAHRRRCPAAMQQAPLDVTF